MSKLTVYFAPWCKVSTALSKNLKEVGKEARWVDITTTKGNTEAQAQGVKGLPTMYIDEGSEGKASIIVGYRTPEQLEILLNKI